tara:strand:+ start:2176 stop:2349 length:174 start_codon:yes stop_codon:yes gene_type:complete
MFLVLLNYVSVGFPYVLIIIKSRIKPKPRSNHHGTPNPAGSVPIKSAIDPAINAYGI